MNICFLIYNISRPGGSERVTSIIADNLAKNGHKVSILSICGNNECYYSISNKVEIHSIFKNKESVNHKLLYLYLTKKVYDFYKKNKINISIDVFASLSLYTLPIKKQLKIKNITWEHFNFKTNSGLNKIARKMACKYSDQIITLTKKDKEAYEKNIKNLKAKIDYIYNPTPFPDAIKSGLDSKNIITVGRLTYQKGYDLLLDVWNIVEKSNKEWRLLIYGTGEDEQLLKEKKETLQLKNVIFKGITKDIDECYRNASIFISTSRWEGLPMCMIEAQSFGLPIISFDYETGPSEIIDDNINGILVENGNIELMA